MSRNVKIALAVVAGIVLLAIVLYGVDVGRVRQLIAGVDPGWLALAAVLYVSAYVVRSLRWRLVLRPVQKVKISESFFMLMAGYFLNYIIPIRAGEIAKSFFLKRLRGVPIATSLPTIFVDKLLELLSIVLVVLLIPVLSIDLNGYVATLVYTVLAVFALALFLLVMAIRSEAATTRFLSATVSWLPARVADRFKSWISLFVSGMGVARANARALGPLVGYTLLAVVIDAIYFSCVFRAFAMDVPFAQVLFGYTLISLSYILPTPPAQIGHNEAVMVVIFAIGFGYGLDEVTAVMILAHIMTGLIVTGLGLWSFGAMSIRVSDSFRHVTEAARGHADPTEGSGAPDDGRAGTAGEGT